MGALHDAAETGNLEDIKHLIQHDPQVVHTLDDFAGFNYTALHCAASKGHAHIVAYLLNHGAHIDQTSLYGSTALHMACQHDRTNVVELLLSKGADPTISTTGGWSPLLTAAYKGYTEVVDCLVRHGRTTNINDRNNDGVTALLSACSQGYKEVVKMLLEAGADPTLANRNGVGPLDSATTRRHVDCMKLLKEWERPYALAKARRLFDANHDVSYYHQGGMMVVPPCLKDRVEKGEELPSVELEKQGLVVGAVVEHVVCSMKRELFVELMGYMGKTGIVTTGNEE